MSVPSPSPPSPAPGGSAEAFASVPRRWFRVRVVLLLLGLTAGISASVIAVDIFSPRDRHLTSDLATSTHPSTTGRVREPLFSPNNGVSP